MTLILTSFLSVLNLSSKKLGMVVLSLVDPNPKAVEPPTTIILYSSDGLSSEISSPLKPNEFMLIVFKC